MRNWITLCENSLTPRFPESTATLKDGSVVELSAEETTEPLGDPDEDDFGETFLHVYAKVNGHTIGSAQIPYEDSAFRGIVVDEDFRRLGVATALYNYAEKLFGFKLTPSDTLEPDGEAFWKARMSESADLLEYKMFNVTYYGTELPLIENPTRSELAGMVARADRRGVVDGKNLFIANAGSVVHEDIVKMAFSIGRWEGTTYEGVSGLKPTYTRSQSSYFYDPTQNLASKFKDEWVGTYAERDCGVKTLAISPTLYVAFFENAEETVMATPAFARLVRGAQVVSFIKPKTKVYSPEENDELLRQLSENFSSFRTEKGSLYRIGPRGETTRDKAYRPEHGVDQQGLQQTSEQTFYVEPALVEPLSLMQTKGGKGTMAIVIDTASDRAAIRYVDGPAAGKLISGTVVPILRSPRVGLIPVELWKNGKIVHFGNVITSVA